MMGTGDIANNHYLAYLSVMNHDMFNKSTNAFKGYNARQMKLYYNEQNGGGFDSISSESIIKTAYDTHSKHIEAWNKKYGN
jgi:hypothetical protein